MDLRALVKGGAKKEQNIAGGQSLALAERPVEKPKDRILLLVGGEKEKGPGHKV